MDVPQRVSPRTGEGFPRSPHRVVSGIPAGERIARGTLAVSVCHGAYIHRARIVRRKTRGAGARFVAVHHLAAACHTAQPLDVA
jgi:hypothetical protein